MDKYILRWHRKALHIFSIHSFFGQYIALIDQKTKNIIYLSCERKKVEVIEIYSLWLSKKKDIELIGTYIFFPSVSISGYRLLKQ